ncbi:hypothetical protein IAD21_00545 [Abditibacteriota bacterium]|nr:hypothetical protein IAD21_00545 [Abditibacteriota bacterium]
MSVVDVLIAEVVTRGFPAAEATLNRFGGSIGRVESARDSLMRRPMTFAAVGAAGVIATSKLVSAALEKAGEAQTTKTGFATLLGDRKKADALFKDFETFSIKTSFDDASTKKIGSFLLATGTQSSQVISRMHAMGNAVAAAGKGDADLQGVAMAMSALGNSTIASRQQIKRLEIRGIQANKILQQELGLTADQVQNLGKEELKGSVVAEALYRGMEKVGKGKAMENMVKTLPGQISTLNDAKNQLLTAIGEPMLGDATKFVHLLAEGAMYMKDMARAHPQRTKALVYGVGAASAATALYGTYRAATLAKLARQALEKAVRSDAKAESEKISIAKAEGKAIAGAGDAAQGTAGKLGILARAKAFLGKDALTIKDSGLLARMGAAPGARSVGQVGLGAATGAAVGYGLWDTMSNHTNQAAMRSMGVNVTDDGAKFGSAAAGVMVGALVLAAPEVALPILAALGTAKFLEGVADKQINEPQERAAEMGTGADNTDIYGKDMQSRLQTASKARDRGALAKIYKEMSVKAHESGDDLMAQRYRLQSASELKIQGRELTPGTAENTALNQARFPVSKSALPTVSHGPLGINADVNPWRDPFGGAPPTPPAYVQQAMAQRDSKSVITATPTVQQVGHEITIKLAPIKWRLPGAKNDDDLARAAYG